MGTPIGVRIRAELAETAGNVATAMVFLGRLFLDSLDVIRHEPVRVYQTFVRSAPATTRATTADLSLLETTPVFGLYLGVPIALASRWWDDDWRPRLDSPVVQTDVLAAAYVLAMTLLYLNRLPLNAMFTVRYLYSIIPFGVYFLARLPSIRRVLATEARLLAYTAAGLVLLGGQLLVVYLVSIDPARGEVFQFHGLLGLAAAALAGIWVVAAELELVEDDRVGAIALAVPLAVGTLFVLLSGLEYFVVADFALGMVDVVSEAIPLF